MAGPLGSPGLSFHVSLHAAPGDPRTHSALTGALMNGQGMDVSQCAIFPVNGIPQWRLCWDRSGMGGITTLVTKNCDRR